MGNTVDGLAIVGGVDTHADTHHAAALDSLGRLLDTREFTVDTGGYRAMVQWLQSLGPVTGIGVEGTGCYGADLTRYLRSCSIPVAEINRPNRQDRRLRGKSDPLDAESAARRLLAATRHVRPKDSTTAVESIRVTAPDVLRAQLRTMTLKAAAARAARFRITPATPVDPVQATKLAMRSIGRRVAVLTDEIDTASTQLTELLTSIAPTTMALFGVSTDHAGQLLVTAGGNPERLHSESAFAALCAANPIPASSGKTPRHRLNPFGDRGANAALHMIAVVRMRHDPATRAYAAKRTTDGLSKREIIRCLKRYIARQAYHAIMTDLGHKSGHIRT
ncbi:transposase [Nocardia transvalensis]|uniref:Transposase n=1 Tax=Nocardia transvalensis TaxID=37333 RepID=A0A7W9PKG3_9NOCA|nr:IS110 family transposase [Nocardia transvalensis]MBB5917264.1 transposase [Nocardia transvalensis]